MPCNVALDEPAESSQTIQNPVTIEQQITSDANTIGSSEHVENPQTIECPVIANEQQAYDSSYDQLSPDVGGSSEIKEELDTEPEAIEALVDIMAVDENEIELPENCDEGFINDGNPFPLPTISKLPEGFIKHEKDAFSGGRIFRQLEVH